MLPILPDNDSNMSGEAADVSKEAVGSQSGGYVARSINKFTADADGYQDEYEKSTPRATSPLLSNNTGTKLLQKIESVLERISGILNNQLRLQVDEKTKQREDFLERAPLGASKSSGGGEDDDKIKNKAPQSTLTQSLIKAGLAAAASAALLAASKRKEIDKAVDKWTRDHLGVGANEDLTPHIKDGLASAGNILAGGVDRVTQALTKGDARKRELAVRGQAIKAGLRGAELNQFMAQTNHESGGYKYVKEIWDGKGAQATYEGRKNLGNTQKGDGFKYRGRGFIQLTGRANYARVGKLLGLDLVNHPELVEDPEVAGQVALIYWKDRVRPRVKDFSNTYNVTGTINTGHAHEAEREKLFAQYSHISGPGAALESGGPSITPVVQGVKSAFSHAGSYLSNLTQLGHQLQSQGFHVSEQKGFGGISATAHHGEGHKDGRAIDVDLMAGIDANDPAAKSKMDAKVKQLALMGYHVLWNHKKYVGNTVTGYPAKWGPHTDHAHVEIPVGGLHPMSSTQPSSGDRLITTTMDAKGAAQIVSNTTNVNTTHIQTNGHKEARSGRPPIPSPVIHTTDLRKVFHTRH